MLESSNSLFARDSDGGPFQSSILDTLRVLRAVFDCMGTVPICPTQRAGVRAQNRAGHFAVRVFQIVRGIETFTFSIVAAKYAYLGFLRRLLCGQLRTEVTF